MAFKRSLSEEDLTCPVCFDIFVDPVILSCSHTLCKACMQTLCIKQSNQCPICRRKSLTNPSSSNLALKNLCEGYIQERDFEASELCSTHREKLKLFCQEDRVPMCLVCWTSRDHKQHECCPIEEAASDYRVRHNYTQMVPTFKMSTYYSVKLTVHRVFVVICTV